MSNLTKSTSLSSRYRMIGIIALAGLILGFLGANFRAHYIETVTRNNIAAGEILAWTDAQLSIWRNSYIESALGQDIGPIAASPEQSTRLLDTRKALINSYEKTMAVNPSPKIFLTSKAEGLVSGGDMK